MTQAKRTIYATASTKDDQKEVSAGVLPKGENGYYYADEGLFLGKIGNSENVFITSQATYNKIIKKESVNDSGIIRLTEKYELNNEDFLNRAHWVFGEGGSCFAERYAMTIDNLKKAGRTGYGPKPFTSESEMYKKTMLHGTPAKCLYPDYFSGIYKGANALKFANARKSANYSEINADPKMVICIKAVIDSLTGKLKNEHYNNWRGSGDTLYNEADKVAIEKKGTEKKSQSLYRAEDKKIYARVETEIDHYWEPCKHKYRRHSFYKITKISVK